MSSGRSGRARGESAAQVETSGRSPPGWTSSRKRPRGSSHSRSTSAGVIDGSPAARRARHQSTFVITSEDGPAAVADPPCVPGEPPVPRDEQREAVAGVAKPSPDPVELRRGVEARFVGLDEPQKAIALEVAVRAQPFVMAGDPRLGGRVADRDPPRPGEERRLDRPRHLGGARGDVVIEEPLQRERPVPEDDVADEAVLPHRGEQGLELLARAPRLEAPPDDRREARVPVPLPRVPRGARPRVGVADATSLSLGVRGGEYPPAELRELRQYPVRSMPRSARAPRTPTSPARATRPGQVPAQVTGSPMKPWRAASTT